MSKIAGVPSRRVSPATYSSSTPPTGRSRYAVTWWERERCSEELVLTSRLAARTNGPDADLIHGRRIEPKIWFRWKVP